MKLVFNYTRLMDLLQNEIDINTLKLYQIQCKKLSSITIKRK
jgi:hypothetical protein